MNEQNDAVAEAITLLRSAVAACARTEPELARMSNIELFVVEADRWALQQIIEPLQIRLVAEATRRGLTAKAAHRGGRP